MLSLSRVPIATTSEAPLPLRFFSTAVKTDSRGQIITGPTSDPVKNIVGPESAGMRAGLTRFTKIMFGAGYIDGRPDPGTRIDPNNPQVNSGKPAMAKSHAAVPKSSAALSITPDGRRALCRAPRTRRLSRLAGRRRRYCRHDASLRWIDLRPSWPNTGLASNRCKGFALNTSIYPRPLCASS